MKIFRRELNNPVFVSDSSSQSGWKNVIDSEEFVIPLSTVKEESCHVTIATVFMNEQSILYYVYL